MRRSESDQIVIVRVTRVHRRVGIGIDDHPSAPTTSRLVLRLNGKRGSVALGEVVALPKALE